MGLGLGLKEAGLGLGLGLVTAGLDYNTATLTTNNIFALIKMTKSKVWLRLWDSGK